jgi:hypothetical protein
MQTIWFSVEKMSGIRSVLYATAAGVENALKPCPISAIEWVLNDDETNSTLTLPFPLKGKG